VLDASWAVLLSLVSHSLRRSVVDSPLPARHEEAEDEETRHYRRHVTALVCTNIDPSSLHFFLEEDRLVQETPFLILFPFPFVIHIYLFIYSLQLMLRLVLDVLLGEVFAFSWILDSMQNKDPALLPKVSCMSFIIIANSNKKLRNILNVVDQSDCCEQRHDAVQAGPQFHPIGRPPLLRPTAVRSTIRPRQVMGRL
jgi:hypothetical protein